LTAADTTPDTVCHISSTLDDNGKAACLLRWGPVTSTLIPEVVLLTARELMAAAAHAETDIALINAFRQEFHADDQMVGTVLAAVRGWRPAPVGLCALRIEAVAGHRTGKPYVRVGRGSMRGDLSPGEARDMAVQWVGAATAAGSDVRLRYALGEWDRLDPAEIEELFGLMRQVQR
jgi:hypothetical protein